MLKLVEGLPYPGLRAFGRDEAHLFFGREDCVDDMIDRLAASRFLAVLGASGSGKSSLVRTGLLRSLELGFFAQAGARWTIAELTPGGQPLRNLAEALGAVGAQEARLDTEMLAALLAHGPRSVAEWCRGGGLAEGHNLLILVDQFEELFRYSDYAAREEAEAFVGLLLECARVADVPIHVVLTMRSEYLGACALIPGLAEEINAGFFLTPRMSREECRSAIEGPAAIGGFEIEAALVNQILNAMASFAPWEEERGVARGQLLSRRADQLPLMQHLLNRLWLRAKARAGNGPILLKFEDYDEVGGLAGALDAHGDEVMASLDPDDRPAVATIFRALVSGPDPTNAIRRPCRFEELAAEVEGGADQARRIVDAFRAVDCNFLRPQAAIPLTDDTLVDISHESLIRQWSALAQWLREEARAGANWRRLLGDMELRAAGEGELLAGLDLASLAAWRDAEQPSGVWAERHGGRFDEAERFLAESREAEDAARQHEADRTARERRRLIGGIGILSALLLAMIALSVRFATVSREANAARQQAVDALHQASTAGGRAEQAEQRVEVAGRELRRFSAEKADQEAQARGRVEAAERHVSALSERAAELEERAVTALRRAAAADRQLEDERVESVQNLRTLLEGLRRECRDGNAGICGVLREYDRR